jgi:putative ABC transport system permease protein
MSPLRLLSLFRNLFRKERVERELDAEVSAYLDELTEEKVAAGMSREQARREARIELGGVEQVKEEVRAVRAGAVLEQFWRDVRVAVRSLRRNRGLTVTVVLTLALGIGANAAVFSVVRGVLLRPLVNRDEDRLIYIRQSAPGIGRDDITFSMPELRDLEERATTFSAFGDFSIADFAMNGVGGTPRMVTAGVVNGSFFEVMGLRPVVGRLISATDDGPKAAPVAVLTHRFWTTAFNADPNVVGTTIRLGAGSATIIGVLEPSVPYPADTELIANVVTSPHHVGATMNQERMHRMTELFGRLAPGASLEAARAELTAIHDAVVRAHPEAYPAPAHFQLRLTTLRDQIVAPARLILLVLLASAAIVFVIACSNVANLILARSVRREGELAVRAALGASQGALRRTLLAESVVLCGAGAVLGVLLADPFVTVVARFAARFSVRALEIKADASLLWVGAGLAMAAAVLLAYIPRLPSLHAPNGLGLGGGGQRLTPGTNRRLRVFATAQIALSFMLLAGAATLLSTLVALQTAPTGYDFGQVLALDIPEPAPGVGRARGVDYREMLRRIGALPGVKGVATGSVVPWRDALRWRPRYQFTVEGYAAAAGEGDPYARPRWVSPGFFAMLGVPLVAGRDFTEADQTGSERVVIVSESVARRVFPSGEAVNRRLWWTNQQGPVAPEPRRIIGVVADVDDENVVPGPAMTIYGPADQQLGMPGRLFVHAEGDAYALVPSVTRVIREMLADQPVERAATLEDVRAEVLSPERLNAFVISGFAGVALLIAVVGVAGVLAFNVSARTRELGVRMALGATPRRVLMRVLLEGATIVAIGIVAGAAGVYAFASVARTFVANVQQPGVQPILGAAALLVCAGVLASLMPAARASHVDVVQALRSE